eukprot:GHRQ01030656.1.p2 GENE.GHRQ01030656.1~~GHRQ01030656.1.p2  ORF type:complete len:120 (+),score=41.44 GHRQ01030656.1:54-362(+)
MQGNGKELFNCNRKRHLLEVAAVAAAVAPKHGAMHFTTAQVQSSKGVSLTTCAPPSASTYQRSDTCAGHENRCCCCCPTAEAPGSSLLTAHDYSTNCLQKSK